MKRFTFYSQLCLFKLQLNFTKMQPTYCRILFQPVNRKIARISTLLAKTELAFFFHCVLIRTRS